MANDQLLTLQQVADRLQVSMSTVRRLVDSGKLKAVRIGRNLRVRPEDLAVYIEASKQ
jgi:excisionase family DNA binding protein